MKCKNKHFRHIILFYFRKGKKEAAGHKKICEVYGVNCLTERAYQDLFKKFRSGDLSLKGDQNVGHLSVRNLQNELFQTNSDTRVLLNN